MIKKSAYWVLMSFIAFACSGCLASCSNSRNEEPSTPPAPSFDLSFTIATSNGDKTRVADISGDSDGSGAENFLDVNDIRYLIFDKDQKFVDDISAKATTVAKNSEFTVYEVTSNVTSSYFSDNIDTLLDFYILALANYTAWGITIPEMNIGDPIQNFFDDGLVMSVVPNSALLQKANQSVADVRQLFPMAGLQHFQLYGSLLWSSLDGIPLDISNVTGKTLNLLRALSKIEVVDKINITTTYTDSDATSPFRISTVTLNGYYSQGRLLPALSQWNRNGVFETQQVEASSSMAGTYNVPPQLGDNMIITSSGYESDYTLDFVYDPVATQLRSDKCPVYSCYFFEYDAVGIDALRQPYLIVRTLGNDVAEGEADYSPALVFPVRIAEYTNGISQASKNLTKMLRNNIYRFEIASIGQDTKIVWTLCSMDVASTEIVFN